MDKFKLRRHHCHFFAVLSGFSFVLSGSIFFLISVGLEELRWTVMGGVFLGVGVAVLMMACVPCALRQTKRRNDEWISMRRTPTTDTEGCTVFTSEEKIVTEMA